MTPAYAVASGTIPNLYLTIQSFLQDLCVPSTCALLEVNNMENLVCDHLL